MLFAATLLLVLAGSGKAQAASNDYAASIRLAVNRWLDVQKPSGFFPYGYNFLEDKESEADRMSIANLTRQVYTAEVLADYYVITDDARAKPVIEKFLMSLHHYSLPIGKSHIQNLIEKTHILSIPMGRYKLTSALEKMNLLFDKQGSGKVLSPNDAYSKAYTGAVALAIMTELNYEHISGDKSFVDMRQAWLEALLALHIPGNGFRRFPTSIDPTPYADGQAWLALALYHRAFPQDQRIAELLSDVDDELIENYSEHYDIQFYHWGTMAASARYTDTKDAKFLTLIKSQTSAFLARKKRIDNTNDCSAAEGLADALGALRLAGDETSELAGAIRTWLTEEMRKVQMLQIQPDQSELVYANARIVAPRLRVFTGSFLAGKDNLETRVDYTAHCVSAMIKLQRQNWTSSSDKR